MSIELPVYPPKRRPNSCGATNGRLRTFPPTRSPSASATNEPDDQQQDTDEGAYDSNEEIANDPKADALQDLAGHPSGGEADE
jgi:hypothetical protein